MSLVFRIRKLLAASATHAAPAPRLLAIAITLLAGGAPVLAQQPPIVIKFSHVVTDSAPKGQASLYFKKLTEERTKGRVQVEVFPNSTLYKDKEELEALQLGSVQMLAPTFSKFGPLGVREFEVLDLPFLFDNLDDARKVTQGPVGKTLLGKLSQKGVVGLAFWDNAFKQFTANKPLRTTDDFKGQKMRIQSSKVLEGQMKALGSLPQVLAFSEVYQALQSGGIDGQENPYSNIETQRFFEVQKYLTVSDHGYHGYVLIANRKFWEGLPPDIQQIMNGVVKDTATFFDQIARKDDDDSLARIKATGKIKIVTLTQPERSALRKATLPVHRDLEAKVGKEFVESVYKASGFDLDR